MGKKLIPLAGAIGFMLISGNVWGETSLLMNLKSGFLVLGGTLMSACLAFSAKTLKDLLNSLQWIRENREIDHDALIREISSMAYISRMNGVKALEKAGAGADNFFLRRGIELVVDGYDRFEIRNILEKEYELYFARKESQAGVLNTMSRLAPVFGFVGTLIGLIQVLGHMGEPAEIGEGMAVALLTTLYGLLFANFLFLPLAKKFSEHTRNEATVFNVILEGIVDIAEQKNSKAISHRLQSYVTMYHANCSNGERADECEETRPKPQRLQLKKIKERASRAEA